MTTRSIFDRKRVICFLLLFIFLPVKSAFAADSPEEIKVDWQKIERVSKTVPSLQIVMMPPLRRDSPIHQEAWASLKDLQADYVRFVPWVPYPKLAVAALEPPASGKTSWDFSLIDPLVEDFMTASNGRPVIMDFSTIPAWMFVTLEKVKYEDEPDKLVRGYGTQGTELRDPTGKELGDYYARLLRWYAKGGFTDEFGKRHISNYKYKFDYWEILNEPDIEHKMSPEQYTRRYDAMVSAMRRVDPRMKFIGMSLAYPHKSPEFFEYFLNAKNHKPNVPLDMISYHFYAKAAQDANFNSLQYSFFEQAESFVNTVRYIETIRKKLSPKTGTAINEIGTILPGVKPEEIPAAYWNLSGAVFAYVYSELARQGIKIAGESQFLGFPSQFPSVSMLDWNTGKPNARYHTLDLLKNNFAPGDKIATTTLGRNTYVYAQGFLTRDGKRKILLVNKRDRTIEVKFAGIGGSQITRTDKTTNFNPPVTEKINAEKIALGGFAVAVVAVP
jgi:hypothetical protein